MITQSNNDTLVVMLAPPNPSRDWILDAISDREGVCVAAVESLPERALRSAERYHPDVVLLWADTLRMCPHDAESFLSSVSRISKLAVVGSAEECSRFGSSASVSGTLDPSRLTSIRLHHAVRALAAGLRVATLEPTTGARRTLSLQLKDHEREVLEGLRQGLSEAAIAERWHLSQATVSRAISGLKVKLSAENLFVLGVQAACYGLVPVHSGGQLPGERSLV